MNAVAMLPDEVAIVRLSPARRTLAVALAGVGAIVLALGMVSEAGHALLQQRCGALVLVYAMIVLISASRGNRWLQKSLRSEGGHWSASSWGGYYGLAALTIFLLAELRDLIPAVLEFEPTQRSLTRAAIAWLIGFSVDSMMNAIWASLWPILLYTKHGLAHLGIFAGVAWGVFTLGGQIFPHHAFAARREDDDEGEAAESGARPE